MAMIRKEAAGDYQVGIYRVTRLFRPTTKSDARWQVVDPEGTTLFWFFTLADAYQHLTGEALRSTKTH